jgi:AcrR family transcriptional regulator
MTKSKRVSAKANEKQRVVFDAAADVFAQYGFKRTTMNDIAQAAGISRPALYLMFNNKEHLFQELAAYRINRALETAKSVLTDVGDLRHRFIGALMIFEKTYTEPVANSPHGAELVDINMSLASDVMTKGHSKLIAALVKVLKTAEQSGEVSFQNMPMTHKAFVELLLSSVSGLKKKASTKAEYRKQTQQVAQIFLDSITA